MCVCVCVCVCVYIYIYKYFFICIIFFYKNGQRKTDHEKVLEKSAESTKEIHKIKRTIFLKLPKNFQILIVLQKRTRL